MRIKLRIFIPNKQKNSEDTQDGILAIFIFGRPQVPKHLRAKGFGGETVG